MFRTRFAPSPNGLLHLGHAYAAIVAHDLAREQGGEFLLRIEDIDGASSREELVKEILEDLAWLGLSWDGPVIRQSARLSDHTAAVDRLKQRGLLYPCHCTRGEIAAASLRMGPDGPAYPGTCKNRDVDPDGAAWRIDIAKALEQTGELQWDDAIAGPQVATPDIFGDVVLVRKHLPAGYHIAVTLDDATDAIDLVTRGTDLFAASHIHRLLQELLGLPVPRWHHHRLLIDADGRKLAKRRDSPSLSDQRRAGEDGSALADALRADIFPAGISLAKALNG
ncbi:MAG: tRNA glutamyl-Q(34) synthetase GluQRS [Novosphingobium sp.]|nr:tRNA glutamyl-Q(34) synthetase GluQRS [Novosphingobium sp.]